MAVALEVTGLSVQRGRSAVLHQIDLRVDAAECVCIVGSNGAGKTSLIAGLLGTLTTSADKIELFGKSIQDLAPWDRVRAGLVIVPQDRGLFPGMTVKENLELGSTALKLNSGQLAGELDQVYTLFPRLAERTTQLAGTLSGGERSMLAIGRGLMAKPRMLILDEPSLGLAPVVVSSIMSTISEINAQGTTILLVEQNVHHAFELASRAYVLETGTVVGSGRTRDLANSPLMKESYLGGQSTGVVAL